MNLMQKLLNFIFVSLCFSLPGEIVNQIHINKNPQGFFISFAIYVIFLFILFFLYKFFCKIVKPPILNTTIWYVLFGIIGLWIEWNLLGNSPSQNPEANQLGMFTFWGAMALMPLIFQDSEHFNKLKKSIQKYWVIISTLMIVSGIIPLKIGLYVSIMTFTYGTIFLNYFILKYYYLKSKNKKTI